MPPEILVSAFLNSDTNLEAQLHPYKGMKAQIGFFNPKEFLGHDVAKVRNACDALGIEIMSIHGPIIDIFDGDAFYAVLKRVRDEYQIDNVTLHPGSGNPIKALDMHRKDRARIEDCGVTIMYENFDSTKNNRSWLPRAKNIYMLPFPHLYMTYDTSHVNVGKDLAQDLKDYQPKTSMIHLSNKTNRKNHLPIFKGDHDMTKVIEFLKKYSGFVTLEYHLHHDDLAQDYQMLRSALRIK